MKRILIVILIMFYKFLEAGIDYATINHSYVIIDFSKINPHNIVIAASNSTWKGTLPQYQNTAQYSSNEYIWYDAQKDDTGDGDYTYPLSNEIFVPQSADIKEFRVTYSNQYLYLMVETYAKPGIEWAQGLIIGIDTESPDTGMTKFIQGDGENALSGPCAEIGSEKIKCDYLLYAYKTFSCRIWDAQGIQIATKAVDGYSDNMLFYTRNKNQHEIGIPISLIGNPSNAKWSFIVGTGFNEGGADGTLNIMREIYPPFEEDLWHGGGGDLPRKDELGPDPDVYDLIGASKKLQEEDLNNYTKISFYASSDIGESLNFIISPNPYSLLNNDLDISFSLKIETTVTIKILDYFGHDIVTLMDQYEYQEQPVFTFYELKYNLKSSAGNKIKKGLYFVQGLFQTVHGTKVVNKMMRIY